MYWEIAFAVGSLVLALAIGYGMFQASRRTKRQAAVTAEATSKLYKDPDNYDEEKMREKARRS